MKYFTIFFLLCSSLSKATTISTHEGNTLIRPFGYIASRPPATARTVELEFDALDFSAQQVCGYTDWSTAVVKLPKQLLSTNYWKKIGDNLGKQAINSVLAISGALPSMLTCNASPTFCAILNKAEALAQANLKFTFDSCQMLEGLNDVAKSQFQPLKGCVQSEVSKGEDSSIAIDRCTIGDSSPTSKDKIKTAVKAAKDNYKSEKLSKKICQDVHHSGYSSSNKVYTVSQTSCEWSNSFFKGISMTAGAKFQHGGTFSESPGEKLYEKRLKKTSGFITKLLDLMHDIRFGKGRYNSTGPQPRHSVVTHKDVLKKLRMRTDGRIIGVCYDTDKNCKPNVEGLPPVYRLSTTGSPPALMISPATLYELVDIIPAAKKPSLEYQNSSMSQIAFALEPLLQSTAFIHAQDVNHNAISRHSEACGEPDMQSPPAQEDCQFRLSKLRQSMASLQHRYDSDRKHVSAQALYYAELQKIRQSHIRIRDEGKSGNMDPVKHPKELR